MFGDLVLDIQPSWRQQVHFNHSIAVVFVCAAGHEPLPLVGHAPAVAEAVRAGAAIARLLLGVVGVRLAVGYKATQLRQRGKGRVVGSGSSSIQVGSVPPHAGLARVNKARSWQGTRSRWRAMTTRAVDCRLLE